MANSIVQFADDHNNSSSPFDAIRQVDERGEFWSARDLQQILGYTEWRKFDDAVDRAKFALKAAGYKDYDHIVGGDKKVKLGSGATRKILDYRLSRFGAYMVAMNGDPRKSEIAAAQTYFASKTREAETVIPAQSEHLRDALIVNENLKLQLALLERTDSMAIMHGVPTTLLLMGRGDHIEEVEKPTIEVIDDRHNVKFSGQTLKQVADYLAKRTGKRFKSGAEIKRFLERSGNGHLIAQTPRTVVADYIPDENLQAVYRLLSGGDHQKLLGEHQ
jgi:hypothetical protein